MYYTQQDRNRNPPRDTFGGKHCFPGVAENEYSRTALASKFSLGMERLSKYCNSLYTCTYTQQDDPATPRETLLGANIAFRGLLKMSTAEQLWPRNSRLEWKDWANIVIPFTHVRILNRTIPQPPERHFWGQTLLSGGCWKWVQPNSSGLEILFWNGKIEQIL